MLSGCSVLISWKTSTYWRPKKVVLYIVPPQEKFSPFPLELLEGQEQKQTRNIGMMYKQKHNDFKNDQYSALNHALKPWSMLLNWYKTAQIVTH